MSFSRLIRFETADGEIKFTDLGPWEANLPVKGANVNAYASLDELTMSKGVLGRLSKDQKKNSELIMHSF